MLSDVRALAVAFAVVVSGCAATVGRPTADQRPLTNSSPPQTVALVLTGSPAIQASADWHTFRAEWRTAFASAASANGLQFVYLDADSGEQLPGTVLARVSVSDYRYLTSGARSLALMGGENSTTTTGDYWKTTNSIGLAARAAHAVGSDELRSDQAHGVAVGHKQPCPVVRPGARLHRHSAWRQARNELAQLGARHARAHERSLA